MAEKLTKRQLKHDKFIESIYGAWAYVQENRVAALAGAVGLVALIVLAVRVGGSVVGGTRAGDPQAEAALSTARSHFFAGRADAGVAALNDVRAAHGKTRAGREATYLLGNALYEAGEYARALEAFQEFLAKPLHGDLLQDGARLAIAACREETGDLAGAAADYLALWESDSQPGTRLHAGLGAARCAAAQGMSERAAQIYQAIADAHPTAPEGQAARYRVLEMRGGVAAPPLESLDGSGGPS